MSIYILFACVLVLMILRVPIYLSIGLGCLAYFVTSGMPLAMLANRAALTLDSFPLIAIPLFMLSGRLMNLSGVTARVFRFCHTAVGFIPGGLGHVNVAASLVFAGMSGSALADIGGLGQIEIKAMRDAGYAPKFAAGVTMSSSILGPIIPPSIAAVIYAINAEVSIAGPVHRGVYVLPEAAAQANDRVWVVKYGALTALQPRVLGRVDGGWVVEAFDAGEGVVVGPLPGARAGLSVTATGSGS